MKMFCTREIDMVLLRCVDRKEAEILMREIHEGSFGTHTNGHTMTRKILRAGYYWLTMESDCYQYAKRCHKCRIYADNSCATVSSQHTLFPLAFFHVGNRHDWNDRAKSVQRTSLHLGSYRLFHQMG